MPHRATIHPAAAALTIVALALVAHGRSLTSTFIWDDDAYVTENMTLRSLDGLRRIWVEPQATPQYYPLVHTTYWIEYRFWGLHPTGYHAVNVALHALSAVLLWRLFVRLGLPAAWLGAALFAVHPVGVESVSWVTERKNTLSMVFALLAANAWLRFRFDEGGRDLGPDDLRSPQRLRWLFIAIACFVLALFSKTVAAMLVGMLAGTVWWKTGRLRMADLVALAPLVVIGLPLALFTVWLEKHHVGAKNVDWHLAPPDRLLIAGRAACFYASKLIWPHPLAFFYARWSIDARQVGQWFFPLAVAAAAAAAWAWRKRIGRGPLAVLGMYLCGLFPALGFFDVFPFKYSFVADHFQYHAMPVCLAAGAAIATSLLPAAVFRPIAVGWLALLTGLAIQRTGVFRDQETLYLDTLAKSPNSAIAAHNLGSWYQLHDREREAEHFLRLGSELALFADERSRSLTNLSMLALRRNQPDEAVGWAARACQHLPGRRGRAVYALALARSGNTAEAERLIDTWADESTPELQLARAECALRRHDIEAALPLLTAFTERETATQRNLALLEAGIALASHAYNEEAETMLWLIDGDARIEARARINIGISRALRGDLDGAMKAFQDAVRHDPLSAMAHGNLAKALAARGLREEALAEFILARQLSADTFAFQRDYEQLLHPSPAPVPPQTNP